METDDLKNMMHFLPKKIIIYFVTMKASRLRNIIDLFTTLLSENAYMRSL
jgi:hypothetical protein